MSSATAFLALLGRGGAVAAWSLAFALSTSTSIPSTRAADAPQPVAVSTAKLARGEIFRWATLPGSLRANQQAVLYAKVPGYLKSIAVDKGDSVTAGQALGEIEVPELLADRTKVKAEVKVATTDYERIGAAQKKAPDLVMPQVVDEARGRLEIARANLERIETLLRYSQLTAPFSGVVTMRFVDPGAFIPAATAGSTAANSAVLTLMDFSTIRAQVPVPEVEAALVRKGQPVTVSVEGLPGKTFSGHVSRLSYALDDASRTMLVEADLPNPDLVLRPGMYATVKVGVERHADVLLLPVEALLVEKTSASAFVAAGGKAKKVPLKLGFNDGKNVEVVSGLTGDEAVILLGKQTPADGQAITLTEAK